MTKKGSWEEFFDAHALRYDGNEFTSNTAAEIEFLVAELGLHPGASILDVGCGTGRHAVELARRGYRVTGVDLSAGMLEQARRKAAEAGVDVRWVQSDATQFSFEQEFDAAICLCEGAFGLLGSADDAVEQPLAILHNISRAVKPGARCLLTVLNGFRMIREHTQDDVGEGGFDPLTISELGQMAPVEGAAPIPLRERGFVPTELAMLFRLAGLSVLGMWGGTAGSWHKAQIHLDEMEIMILAAAGG